MKAVLFAYAVALFKCNIKNFRFQFLNFTYYKLVEIFCPLKFQKMLSYLGKKPTKTPERAHKSKIRNHYCST